jgi:hypothetical protein
MISPLNYDEMMVVIVEEVEVGPVDKWITL